MESSHRGMDGASTRSKKLRGLGRQKLTLGGRKKLPVPEDEVVVMDEEYAPYLELREIEVDDTMAWWWGPGVQVWRQEE